MTTEPSPPNPDRVVDTGTDTVRIEVVERVGVITLTRPDRRNALHPAMFEPMIDAVQAFAAAPDIGCVVVTGEGSAFCAGGDVGAGGGSRGEGPRPSAADRAATLTTRSQISVVLRDAPIVTMAAINGAAVGAGLSIALACDLRIAAESASFVTGWARLGFSGDLGGPWLLADLLGRGRALELIAGHARLDATEAASIGLVHRVVADDEFASAWRAWAHTFANGPRPATALMKQNVANAERLTLAEAVAVEATNMIECAASADHREGVRAWMEKREPRFGRG
jgi:2-(1,2-epoxy-1,2-dihydrophenyl)acetyl-CoA isomerase